MLAGFVRLSTPYFGLQKLEWFVENKPNERFLIYCWDFTKNDFTLGWAYNIHKVDTTPTIRVKLDNGSTFVATPNQEILLRSGEWIATDKLAFADHLMAFNKLKPNIHFNRDLKSKQFPRIYTHRDGWKTERQFIDEWRTGKVEDADRRQYMTNRLLAEGTTIRKAWKIMETDQVTFCRRLKRAGYSLQELRQLGKETDYRRIIGIEPWNTVDVYDAFVETYANLCTESTVVKSN